MIEALKQMALLESLADRHGTTALRRRYNASADELLRSLRGIARKSSSRSLDPVMASMFIPRLRSAQLAIAKDLSKTLGKLSRTAQKDGIRAAVDQTERFEERFAGRIVALSLNDTVELEDAVEKDRGVIEREHDRSMLLCMTLLQDKLARLIAMSGTGRSATTIVLDEIEETMDAEFWKIERIARTELASAYNLGVARGITSANQELGEIGMRWCEKVDDKTGRPLDDRVASDSMVLHGQVSFTGYDLPASARSSAQLLGGFEMPPDERVSSDLWGRRYIRPPNRPYDRAVGQPWSPRWKVPAYRVVRGERIPM
jgi:hypothetical protein